MVVYFRAKFQIAQILNKSVYYIQKLSINNRFYKDGTRKIYSIKYKPKEIQKLYHIACRCYHVRLSQQKHGWWQIIRCVGNLSPEKMVDGAKNFSLVGW
jgi:hypothetical protein